MDPFLESLYWLKIALDGGIVRVAHRRAYRTMQAFIWYRACAIVRSAVLLPLHLAGTEAQYSAFYWISRPCELVFLSWFAGWLAGIPGAAVIFGLAIAAYQYALYQLPKFGIPAEACSIQYLQADQLLTSFAILCAVWAWFGPKRRLATGLLIATLFPAIWQTTQAPGLRFVPTISVVVAQLIWIWALAPENKAE